MRIAHINFIKNGGGAARAAARLNAALNENGFESELVFHESKPSEPSFVYVDSIRSDDDRTARMYALQTEWINAHRTNKSNTLFSLEYPGLSLLKVPSIAKADIIHLHWVTYMMSPATIRQLYMAGKPLVWTLHDMRPMTGGCHYSAGCTGYLESCAGCPQLDDVSKDLASALLADRVAAFSNIPFSIVAPSQWLADRARASAVFRNCSIKTIPNCVEHLKFQKSIMSQISSVAREKEICLLFGAEMGDEYRKGFSVLLDALNKVVSINSKSATRLKLICFGTPPEELNDLGISVESLGYINKDEALVDAYSSADLFVLPSIEDNLPNTMLEAMSCGTPVLGSRVAGMLDTIEHGKNGILFDVGNAASLADEVLKVLSGKYDLVQMGNEARSSIERNHTFDVQAKAYQKVYEEALSPSSLIVARPSDEFNNMAAVCSSDHGLLNSGIARQLLKQNRSTYRMRGYLENVTRFFTG